MAQLILTLGRSKIYNNHMTPPWLGAFDANNIIFLPYDSIQEIFFDNDFNWQVAPSDHNTREFRLLLQKVADIVPRAGARFNYTADDTHLRQWIRANLRRDGRDHRIRINRNNFISIYQKWERDVKPSINVPWDEAKREGVISADFYLADILSRDNTTLREKLRVVLKKSHYTINLRKEGMFELKSDFGFLDDQKAHTRFWNRYERPPHESQWDKLVERRDLLVPPDIRERKGSFFTPQVWVAKSQEYLADALGPDWQDDYYVWDCCAGTGNLLNGLDNTGRLYASTLDPADVKVMHDRIASGNANLLQGNVFQFDFLNDDLKGVSQGGKLPDTLAAIVADPERRKKLVVYINPPYAEATTATTVTGTGKNKAGTANTNATHATYKPLIGKAANELFALFFIRIYIEIGGCVLAEFSTLKILQASNFVTFRSHFRARLLRMFVMPAATFDNVKGQFPIGFMIWDTAIKESFRQYIADVFDQNGFFLRKKRFNSEINNNKSLNDWLTERKGNEVNSIGLISCYPADYQNNGKFSILSKQQARYCLNITAKNLTEYCIYLSVRHCIAATWLNDRDQFLYPNEGWKSDNAFQSDCLAFALLHGQNRISAAGGAANHWIPYTEREARPQASFASHFMSDFLRGKLPAPQAAEGGKNPREPELPLPHAPLSAAPPAEPYNGTQPVAFTPAAQAVMEAGLALWRHYHQAAAGQPGYDANASYYDIRRHFQGTSTTPAGKERMNNTSPDDRYNQLLANLRHAQRRLAAQIADKVYEYGFLR